MYQNNYSRRHNNKVVRYICRITMNTRAKNTEECSCINKGQILGSKLKNHLLIYIVVAFVDNLDHNKTMQKYFIFIYKMQFGSSSH